MYKDSVVAESTFQIKPTHRQRPGYNTRPEFKLVNLYPESNMHIKKLGYVGLRKEGTMLMCNTENLE